MFGRPALPTPLTDETRARLRDLVGPLETLDDEEVALDEPHGRDESEPESSPKPAPRLSSRWGVTPAQVKGVAALGALTLAFAGWWAWQQWPHAAPDPSPRGSERVGRTSSASASPSPTKAPTPTGVLVVHVAGSVKSPGIVELPVGSRVAQAIAKAGGLTDDAAPGALNLAAPLADGSQVLVAREGQTASVPAAGAGGGVAAGSSSAARLNLNSATLDQLDELPGVGPVTARKILAWRTAHGRFSKVDELGEIDGIGQKTLAKLRELVDV